MNHGSWPVVRVMSMTSGMTHGMAMPMGHAMDHAMVTPMMPWAMPWIMPWVNSLTTLIQYFGVLQSIPHMNNSIKLPQS